MNQINKDQEESEEGFFFEIIDLERKRAGEVSKRFKFEKLTKIVSEKIFSFIPTLSDAIQQNIEKCKNKPEEINCEFGVVIGGKAKFFIGELSSQAQLKVNIKWTNPKKSKN